MGKNIPSDRSRLQAQSWRVSADATNDVWAVGTLAFGATVIEHFNGTAWSVVSSPSPGLGEDVLTGVTALAPNNVWAVGFYATDLNTDRPTKTLIEHWDGSSWKVVSSPNIGPHSVYQSNHLGGITTVSANDVWAFGDYYAADGSAQIFTLVLHWDGISWKVVPSPPPANSNTRVDILFGGTVIPQGNLWLRQRVRKNASPQCQRTVGQIGRSRHRNWSDLRGHIA